MIYLDKEHGVNPSVENCYLCGEPKGIVLWGTLRSDTQKALADADISTPEGRAPHSIVMNKEPCDKCKGYMEQGVILISTRNGENGDNPYRTGGWVVLKDEAVRRMINTKEVVDQVLEMRVAFVPDEVWDMMGLPRGEVEGVPNG